ncbi:MAG: bifunctional diaminohydroxyphosphoribosylaminopyrimidine deaminase/5-amino-6-(5-phosphoribosylamino)uracil reductase RibD [Saprospiraceae bacterium]|nr:bifunctional diaminohydroxyphosphoribosylaminopyrimidine deaminase/5-amino-6-(5-phosphoribosylamino)uracil reductase RibD [Saprospiraceae bacterium]
MDLRKKHLERLRMRRCFDIARLGIRAVKTNPAVGALIVKGDTIISEDYHKNFGGPHAEVNAISSISSRDLAHSSIYVSLEPCAHYGKTPPCVDLLMGSGIDHCIISSIDPNPLVQGRGVEKLRSGGIKVTEGINRLIGQEVLRPFKVQQKFKRPYIILKWAQSLDGFLGRKNERIKISSPVSDRLVHKWRAETDSIMVGSNTVIIDNPHLSNRLYFGENPVRVILDRQAQISPSAPIWTDQIRTFYFSNRKRKFHNPLIESFVLNEVKEPLLQLFSQLYRLNIGSVLVEGGSTLVRACMNQDLWDEARVIISPVNLNHGLNAPALATDPARRQQLGRDQIAFYYHQ